MELLLHLVQKVQSRVEGKAGQVVEADVTLAAPVLVTVDTIIFDQISGPRRQGELRSGGEAGSGSKKSEAECEEVFSMGKDHKLEQANPGEGSTRQRPL
jgi:hypothetical protein